MKLLLQLVFAFTAVGSSQAFSSFSSSSTFQVERVFRSKAFRASTLDDISTALEDKDATKVDPPMAKTTSHVTAPTKEDLGEEDARFDCDESVAFWKTHQLSADQAPAFMASIVSKYLLGSSASAAARAYWIYHLARSGYFSTNAVVGSVAHVLYERIIEGSEEHVMGLLGSVSPSQRNEAGDTLLKLWTEAVVAYEQDWKWIDQGILNYPWDATLQAQAKSTDSGSRPTLQLDHKQANPFFALQETRRLVRESIAIWGRRARLAGKPAGVWLGNEGSHKGSNLDSKEKSGMQYPAYFLNDFHYQTDGWMSTESANTYEVSTETLFLGRQDAMQRQTLVPLKQHFIREPPQQMLEVACGTGRHATFARDNFPTTNMTLVDLSPFYLNKARENDRYWRQYRGELATKLATNIKSSSVAAMDTTTFVQANAEELPFPDNTFDAVTTVYLFHELPHEARVRVALEMARVCKPGGMVVFSDSLQTGDRPPLDRETVLADFSKLNEPHYASYLAEDIAALFTTSGNNLTCGKKFLNSRTKTLSFIKE